MISFHQFINLKEALSLTDPLAQSTLKIIDKTQFLIDFEFTLNDNYYTISISNKPRKIYLGYGETLDTLNLMEITLKVNNSYDLTNQSGMQANTVYNMLLNAIKQANDYFGENNIHGYSFAGAHSNQDLMYDKLMRRFAPNLITWLHSKFLKPESIQRLKEKNPDLIDQINNQIYQSTSQRKRNIQQKKQDKNLERSLRRQP